MRRLPFRPLVLAASTLFAAISAHAQDGDFKGMTLTVLGVNSDLNAVYMATYGKEFEQKTGAKLVIVTGSSADNLSKVLVAKGKTPSFQVLALENPTQAQAIQAAAIRKQDFSQMPNTKNLADGAVPSPGYGPAYDFFRFGTCVNVAQYKAHKIALPTGIDGWFDPAIAGHSILPTPSNFWWTTGMQALAEHYRVSLNDPTPLFDKLKDMRPASRWTSCRST
jgi:spermidine/putrescine-binding protein